MLFILWKLWLILQQIYKMNLWLVEQRILFVKSQKLSRGLEPHTQNLLENWNIICWKFSKLNFILPLLQRLYIFCYVRLIKSLTIFPFQCLAWSNFLTFSYVFHISHSYLILITANLTRFFFSWSWFFLLLFSFY